MPRELLPYEYDVIEMLIWKILDGLPRDKKTEILMNVLESIGP